MGEVGILLLVHLEQQHIERTRSSLQPTHKLEGLLKTPFLGMLASVKMLCSLSKNTTRLRTAPLEEPTYEFWAPDFDLASEKNLNWMLTWHIVNRESLACTRNVSEHL